MVSSRRGQAIFGFIMIVIVLVTLGIILVITNGMFQQLNDDIQSDAGISEVAKENAADTMADFPNTWDNLFFFFLILAWIFLLVTSFFADGHPIMFAISIILLVFVFIGAMTLANTYEEISTDSEFATFAAQFPKMNWVMEHLLVILIFMGFTSAMVLYSKARG